MPVETTAALTPDEADLIARLETAIVATLAGRPDEARTALARLRPPADRPVPAAPAGRPAPGQLAGGPAQLTVAATLAIFRRDGWTCRYCRRPVVLLPVVNLLYTLYPEVLHYYKNWTPKGDHPVHWSHAATVDHVWPRALGGTHAATNLATACYSCQQRKGSRRSWLPNPLAPPAASAWDGLSGEYPALYAAWEGRVGDRPALCGNAAAHRAWRAALRDG